MSSTSNLTLILIIIFTIDLFLFFAQAGIEEINPNALGRPDFYNYEDSFLHDFDAGNYTLNQSNPELLFPTGEESVSEEGTVFTDIFKSTKEWLLDTLGLRYILNFLGAPAIFLASINVPSKIVFGFSALWWGVTLFIIISFTLGRS